ncbi:tautomerase family protein [Nocardia sp. CA-145437]|uniref:tautomerase family protein n=1 Tax=Nocardia sp. CA-145437 TaxID=3239980 RepID=UPI003D9903AF
MTIITVTSHQGRLSLEQRRELARTLTDAALVPEIGHPAPEARIGFQVHFVEREPDMMAIGGVLVADQQPPADVMVVDIAVMDGDWTREVRATVIQRTFAALIAATGAAGPEPTWWINFRIIDEGSWGSRGGVLSILDLLASGVFTDEKAAAIRAHISTAPQS